MTEWDLPRPHVLSMVVDEDSIDNMGHANNAAYVQWMEKVAWDHTEAIGLGWDTYNRLNRGFVARHTELEYLSPAFAGDRLLLGTWIVQNDFRISMTRRYQIIRENDGVTLVRGHTRWVCVAVDSGKPRRMPPEFVEGYPVTLQEPR